MTNSSSNSASTAKRNTVDAVYLRRGWDGNSVPTVEKLRELGLDLPEVVKVVERVRK